MRLQNRPELLLNLKICHFKMFNKSPSWPNLLVFNILNVQISHMCLFYFSWQREGNLCVPFFPLPHSHTVKMTEMKAKKWAILDERRKQRRARTVVFIDRCRLHDVTLLLLHAVFLLPMKLSSYVFRWTDSSTMTWGCSNAWQLFSWFWAW